MWRTAYPKRSTENVYQLIGGITSEVKVIRNDEMTVEEVAREKPKAIVLSPGQGRPEAAGICCDVVRRLSGTVSFAGCRSAYDT